MKFGRDVQDPRQTSLFTFTAEVKLNVQGQNRRTENLPLEIAWQWFKPNTHRRRRRDSAVELSHVGGVNAPVGSRDPVYNFLCCWAIEFGDRWRHNDVIVEKVIDIDQNSRSKTAMETLLMQFPNCRPNSMPAVVVSCSHRRLSRVGVRGV